jgi:hypothetical protein
MSNDDAGLAADIAGEDAALEALEVTDVPVSADESGESSLLAIVVGEDEEEKDDDDAGVRALGGRRWQSIDDMTDAVKPFCLRRGFGITPFYVAYPSREQHVSARQLEVSQFRSRLYHRLSR